ncbi:hypothetical protein OG280_10490 [Streptomyces virginiae]
MGGPPAVARGLRTRAAIAVPARAQQDAVFHRGSLHQPPRVGAGLGYQMTALLRQLNTACLNADQAFEEHADAPIIRSFPGLGSLTGARVLAEIGD